MEIETLEKVIKLKKELDKAIEILEVMNKERSRWWSFITPDTKSENDGYGLYLTDRLRKRFREIVEESIVELKKEIEEL